MILFMNRKLITLLMAALLVLTVTACHSNEIPSTEPSDETQESIRPGLVELEDPIDNPFSSEPTNNCDPTENTEPTADMNNSPTEGDKDSTEESTTPTEIEKDPTEDTVPPTTESNGQGSMSANAQAYAAWLNMSGEQQQEFMNSFDSIEAFFAWLNAAKAEYEAQNPGIDVGDGNIDIGGNG